MTDYSWLFGTLLNSMDFSRNNLWWGRLAYQDSVVTFGAHYESLSLWDKELYFAESKVDYTKDEKLKASIGNQDPNQHFEDGLDLRIMTEDERDLTNVDHWNLLGLNYYMLQCRHLAEGSARPYYKDREGVHYLHDVYMDLMMGGQYKLNSKLYPKHFPKMGITEKLEYGLKEFEKTLYYHKDGKDELDVRVHRRNWFYIYACNIYDLNMPNFMMCNVTTFRILRNNFAKLFVNSDDRMSNTSSKL